MKKEEFGEMCAFLGKMQTKQIAHLSREEKEAQETLLDIGKELMIYRNIDKAMSYLLKLKVQLRNIQKMNSYRQIN